MASSYDQQRLQLNKNSFLIASVRDNKNVAEKVYNIDNYLKQGADINFVDRNDQDSAPIHIAVQMCEPDVVQFLINNGANLNLKNLIGETPLDIAQGLILNTDKKQHIINLLQAANGSGNNIAPIEVQNVPQNSVQTNKKTSKSKKKTDFIKRTGTAGVCGQLYETKLLTLVLMRALNSHSDAAAEEIEQFYLGTNINGIGDLDDICLRYRVKGHPNDIVLFVQAKHRDNPEKGKVTVEDIRSTSGDFSLRKYFDSYLKIKDKFQTKNIKETTKKNKETGVDVMFDGEFSSVECNLILYTPAKDSLAEHKTKIKNNEIGKEQCVPNTNQGQRTEKKKTDKNVSKNVHYLISTGPEQATDKKTDDKVIFQYHHDEEDIDNLTKLTVIERIKKLGSEFLSLVMSEADKSQVILSAELIARYHVVMGRQVLYVPEDQEPSDVHRKWKFRSDFFTSDCEYLVTLRDTFYKILSTTRCDQSKIIDDKNDKKPSDKENFKQILRKPIASSISTLIGKLVLYNEKNKKLQLLEVNKFKEMFNEDELEQSRERLNKIETLNETIIREAIQIKLESIELQLPLAFGNLDSTINDNKKTTVAEKLINFFRVHKDNKNTVEINEEIVGPGKAIEKGLLKVGIGSAVGNLLIFDSQTKTMKFDVENNALPTKAASLLNELKNLTCYPTNKELSSYRIKINIGVLPKDSFHGDEFDKRQARDFLSKLWFYTNQAKEDEVERIIKNGINKYYNHERDQYQLKLRIHTDSIFLRSHDYMQKWWMSTGETPYFSRESEIFERAKLAVLENPLLLTALDYMCNLKIQNIGIKFNQDAIGALELGKNAERQTKIFNVITDSSVLSVIKIMQHFETSSLRNKFTFIDFDYVLSLPLYDYNTMLKELEQTKIETLIVIYEKLKYYEGLCNKLKEVIKLFKGKIIVVTENVLANEIKKYVGDKYSSVRDDKTYLDNMDESSQTKILEESTIVFQGEELPVKSVLDQDARSLVRTEILKKLLDGEKIEIGYPLMDDIYKGVNNFIDRRLNDDPVNTLQDIDDEIVILSGRPGMGKSALLTHLSLNTKQLDPLPWIVRVNLQDHIKEFKRWQEQNSTINVPFVLNFLCKIALKNIDTEMKIELGHYEGKVTVSHVNEDTGPLTLFELEWFLYLYNSGQVVFLFDDFNAMNPHYEKEALQILKLLKIEKKRMWITTCPYKHTRIPLENVFGASYELDPFNAAEVKVFLDRFFRTNLSLEKLNYDQFENVRSFLKFMSKFTNYRLVSDPDRELLPIFSLTFQLIYTLAVAFFQSEINQASGSTVRNRFKENFRIDLDQYTTFDEMLGRASDDDELELAGTPLHLYIAANYFKVCMEDISFLLGKEELKDKWKVVLNSVTLYQHYVEAHMKRIFCREDPDDESVRYTYQNTRRDFFDKHKKLGLFAICRENDLTKLLKPNEISEVQETISKIQRGEDRDSLVNCVVDKVPRFAHLVFAEYFAVECLTDMMKSLAEDDEEKMNPLKYASLWQSIMNILLFKAPPGVRQKFDYKLQSDGSLAEIAKSPTCREVVFELLLKQGRTAEARDEGGAARDSPVTDAVEEGFNNIAKMLLSSIQLNLHQGNVDEIQRLLVRSKDKVVDFGKEYGETLKTLLDSIRDMDVSRLGDIVKSGRLTEVPLRHASSYYSSASELRERMVETTAQLPELSEHVQRLYQQSDNIGKTITTLVELGVKSLMNGVVDTLQAEDSDSE